MTLGEAFAAPATARLSGKFTVRPRAPGDAADLFVLFNEPDFLEMALMRDAFRDASEINPWLDGVQASRRCEWVVTCDGACVAFGALYLNSEHFDHCGALTMGVRKAYRGHGLGNLLARALVAKAQSFPGMAKLALTVLVDNDAAIRLYRRHGFAIEGLHRRFARRSAGGYCDAYSMALLLDPPAKPG